MLVRQRKSRIYFLRRFFAYPISLSKDTLKKLGLARTVRIGLSYMQAMIRPIRNEQNLEQFFINRFGKELYQTLFQAYTEKVWGISCDKISAEWGAQRVIESHRCASRNVACQKCNPT
jgi:protoporphyrinogen oxidase